MRATNFPIGVLSAETGVNVETIRYYEKIGLMPAPPRTEGRQRVYDSAHLRRLTFIRRSRKLGFSLEEIRDLLGLERGHALTCAEVKQLTQQHVADIRTKVRDLRRLERVLNELAARCHGKSVPDCPILDALGGNGAVADKLVKSSRVGVRSARRRSPANPSDSQDQHTIPLRLVVVGPVPGVAMALRGKNDELVARTLSDGEDVALDLEVRAKRAAGSDAPRFLGPFVFGPPAKRFVYIRVGSLAGQPKSCWTRAAKIPLSGITWTMIDHVAGRSARLTAKVAGRARDGGPLCATVPLMGGGWRVARSLRLTLAARSVAVKPGPEKARVGR